MAEHRTRRRVSRPVRVAIYLATVAILASVPFAGAAVAAPARKSDDKPAERDQDQTSEIVEGTPCSTDTIACVSLGAKKAWLFEQGEDGQARIGYGPVSVATGGPGKETPVGDFVVQWKDKDHKSQEFYTPPGCKPSAPGCKPAPMPFSVFFADGGIAFHEGTLQRRSAGCVRLQPKDAQYYYNFLQLGDKVEVRG